LSSSEELPSKSDSKRQQVLSFLYRWLIWRIPALCFWYWLLALRGRELELPILQYLGLIALAPIVYHTIRRKWWRGLAGILLAPLYYVFGFSFVVIRLCGRFGRRLTAILWRALRFTKSPTGFVIAMSLFVVFSIVIPMVRNPTALSVLGYANLAIMNVLFLCAIAFSSRPLDPVLFVFRTFWRLVELIVEAQRKSDLASKAAVKSTLSSVRSLSSWLRKHLVDKTGGLRNIEGFRRWTGPMFAIVVFGLFLVFVWGYALVYYSLQSAGVDVLPGLGEAPSVGLACYYSLTISTAALHQGVIPNSSIGRAIQSLHLINVLIFLGSSLFLFSYAMRDSGKQWLGELRDLPNRGISRLDKLIDNLNSLESLPSGDGNAIDIEGDEVTDNNVGSEP